VNPIAGSYRNKDLRILHVVPSLDPRFGGPGWSVANLCRALAEQGAQVTLATLDLNGSGEDAVDPGGSVSTIRVRGWHLERLGGVIAPGFRRCLERVIMRRGIRLVHDHGLWLQTNRDASLAAQGFDIPLIAAPRGTLEAWPRSQKRWKKRLAWNLYQRRALQRATILHATSLAEANSFRDLGLGQPVAILPNAVCVAPSATKTLQHRNGRVALFLSRIHPKKGLLNLVEAWSEVRPEGWTLLVVGPDEAGYRAEVEAAARARGLGNSFQIRGPAYGEEKRALLDTADLFVLPTLSENFGIAVAEALAAGVPVITTRAAPWRDLQESECGWWIEVGPKPLAQALLDATSRSPEELVAMGRRGQRLIQRKYTWDRIAERTLRVYAWLLGKAPRPDDVIPARAGL